MFLQSNKKEIERLPEGLKELTEKIPELLQNSKAESTNNKYSRSFKKWQKWANDNSISNKLPIKPLHVCIYISFLMQNNGTLGSINDTFYGIRWAHNLMGEVSPTESLMVKLVLEGAKRTLSKPVNKKEVITKEDLNALYDKHFDENNVYNQRFICMVLLSYSGFLRSSEVLNLVRTDIRIEVTHMSLSIKKSKTDIYRDGASVIIARSSTKLCPVTNLELYLKLTSIHSVSGDFIFRNMNKTKEGYILRQCKKSMSYTRFRELFILWI